MTQFKKFSIKCINQRLCHNYFYDSLMKLNETKSLIYQWASSLKTSHSSSAAIDVATIMESLLERLIEEYDEGLNEDAFFTVSNKEYNVVMNAYRKSTFFREQERQQKQYRQRQRQHRRQVKYGIIDGYGDGYDDDHDENEAKNVEHEGIIKLEALLQRMKDRYENYKTIFDETSTSTNTNQDDGRLPPKPDIYTFNTLLSAYSHQFRNEKAVQKAEDIIKMLESSTFDDEKNATIFVKPDTVSYNVLMNIFANQVGEYGYAQKAEDVLLNMSKMRKEGSDTIVPDTTSFNIVLKAWKNSGGGSIECKYYKNSDYLCSI